MDAPDLRSILPDLVVPTLSEENPRAGIRTKQILSDWPGPHVYHVLCLPTDWSRGKTYPVIVEYTGNGGYRNAYGDFCGGAPEEGKLGYGIAGGTGFIWLCLPFLDESGTANVSTWWGTPPAYDPRPTVAYALRAVPEVCAKYGGDSKRVIFAGFSRGAIAGHAIGLHDDRISSLWRAFVPIAQNQGGQDTSLRKLGGILLQDALRPAHSGHAQVIAESPLLLPIRFA